MKKPFTLLSIFCVLVYPLVCVPAVTAGSLKGMIEIDIPYNEIAKNESVDALMMITNTGADPIAYLGNESGISMIPEQAVFKLFNRSEGVQIPLGLDDAGLKMNWERFEPLALSNIPGGGSAYMRITSVIKPLYAGAPPRDSMIVEVIIGENAFLSSDVVDLPESSEVNPAALPSIAELKWSDGRSLLFKKTVIGGERFLLAVSPVTLFARRVARIPPGYDVSVSHDPLLGRHDGIFTQKMIIRFTGGNYEDLIYNWARYQIVSGHPDTVPNAFMRLPLIEATVEEARRCLEENSRKPWLKSFGTIPFGPGSIPGGVESAPFGNGTQSSVNQGVVPQQSESPDSDPSSAAPPRAWLVWLAAVAALIGGAWILFLLVRSRHVSR